MKFRLVATTILALLLAAPVIATSNRFTDVPQDHEFNEAIEWSYNRGLFQGYVDRSFKPDRELSENELQIVVKRLFDSYDSITRAQTAAILYYGITYLENGPPTTTTTTTTRPIITTTTTTTTRPIIRTTTTLAAPLSCPFPLGEVEWLSDNTFRFPIDNGGCNILFSASLDYFDSWGTSWDIVPFETGYSPTFTWEGSARRTEVGVFEFRDSIFYYEYYLLYKDGRSTPLTTRVIDYG